MTYNLIYPTSHVLAHRQAYIRFDSIKQANDFLGTYSNGMSGAVPTDNYVPFMSHLRG